MRQESVFTLFVLMMDWNLRGDITCPTSQSQWVKSCGLNPDLFDCKARLLFTCHTAFPQRLPMLPEMQQAVLAGNLLPPIRWAVLKQQPYWPLGGFGRYKEEGVVWRWEVKCPVMYGTSPTQKIIVSPQTPLVSVEKHCLRRCRRRGDVWEINLYQNHLECCLTAAEAVDSLCGLV